ncbi:hypothetical protein CHS0354_004381 [Potamilus streckersoni]|uniref:Sterile alpha motif domain-containing protein 9-like n=1 Tax=Potamilus streckersoni TaxID=2493646 RepID=A0AAE0T049_9BIVA|nr:hypothetical protein CHS0354_004381 [Potamilus streckersoni]
MAERRKRKSKKKGAQRATLMNVEEDPGVVQQTSNVTMNVIKMKNCQEIHIGNKTVSMALSGTTLEEEHFDLDKELVLSYYSVRAKPGQESEEVNIQALETVFLSRHKSSKKISSFKDVGKQKLLQYLRAKGELYILSRQDDRWNVKPTPQAIERYSPHKASESITEEAEKSARHSTLDMVRNYSSLPTVGVMSKEEKPWYKTPTSGTHSPAKDTSKGAIPKRCGTERRLFPAIDPEDTEAEKLDLRPQHALTPQQQMKHPLTEIQKLMTAAKDFQQGHYILINCEKERPPSLESLSLVPWLAVFDFDQDSRRSGLLLVVESQIKKMKALNICTWKDQPRYTDGSVQWCFMRGCPDMPESLLDTEPKKWSKDYQASVESFLQQLENFTCGYTNLTIFILWPKEEKVGNLTHHISKFIMRMEESVEPVSVILCDCGRMAKSRPFTMLCEDLEKLTCIHLNLEQICRAILNELKDKTKRAVVTYKLPTENGTCDAKITDEDAAWLRDEIEILYLKNPYAKTKNPDELKQECEAFFRGGTIKWPIWYECGSGHLDVERDLLQKMVEKVKSYGENFKSERIILSHAPGSGGTTFAQRLLWELKEFFPCAQAKLHTGTPISECVSRIEFLGSRTHLPVVLLLDGEEMQRVDHLRRMVKDVCLIILYVKRYPYSMKNKQATSFKFWLQGKVSQCEANMLSLKFQDHCDEESKKMALQALSMDVKSSKVHYVYEFGLTAYEHEYRGVQSYVRGYLQVEKNQTAELLPWQTVLGYLSLVYYYGQSSVPCQFFGTKLGFSPNATITIDDFPSQMTEFIVPDVNEAKKNMIRICHFIIAKEILEQILTRHQPRSIEKSSETLSKEARSNLHNFAMEFIEYASKKKVKAAMSLNIVNDVLARTFIFRDSSYIEEPDVEFVPWRKPKLSQLMSDIECCKPYTERLNVFKKLVECFPNNPNFHAHLGRFYGLYRRDDIQDEKKAQQCFDRALSLCKDELAKDVEAVDDQMRVILKYIYHMYGMIYNRRISPYTGKSLGDKPEHRTSEAEFKNRVEDILHMVQLACFYFGESRRYCPKSGEDSFGYCGEITARLQLSDFTHRHIQGSLIQFIHSTEDTLSDLRNFIKESICEISDLIRECLSILETVEIDPVLYQCIEWYEALFKMEAAEIKHFIIPNSMENRRLKIAAIKLKYTKSHRRTSLEYVTTHNDITEIIKDYEGIFHDIHQSGCEFSLKALDLDYREWIIGIRHFLYCKNYSVEEVLIHVRQWNGKVESLYSKYYLFIMYSLLGLGPNGTGGSKDMMKLAIEVKPELCKMSKTVVRSKYPWEWYGKGDGIKSLITGTRFYGLFEGRNLGKSMLLPGEDATRLVVLKGTICKPNTNKMLGYINLDMERNAVPIQVAFVPMDFDLNGRRYVGEMVELLLGFSVFNGFEGFNVKLLQRYKCHSCDLPVEVTSYESSHPCICGNTVHRIDSMI